ncbi:hypothetical protein [Streptomyces sp. HM190]|nr:hypothetical protein [Streptomyces sp. HM190]
MDQGLVDGGFRMGRVIGQGDMAEVHRAQDLHAPITPPPGHGPGHST